MALDVLNPSINKAIGSIGGFCLIDESEIDNENYFRVDADSIGVYLDDDPSNTLVAAVKIAKG